MATLSWSKLKTWRRCPNQYYYKYIERLVPKRPPTPLLRGTMMHAMIDFWSSGQDPEAALIPFEIEHRKLFDEEKEEFDQLKHELKTIMAGYAREYEEDGLDYIHSEHRIQLRGLIDGMDFIGVIDKIAKDKNGRLWLMDHKTHRTIPNEEDRYHDLQLLFYVWAWNELYPDQQLDGIIWDYIRWKIPAVPETLKSGELSQRANIDTDHFTYLSAIKRAKLDPADYKEILGRLAKEPNSFFKRVPLPSPSDEMIAQIVRDARVTAAEIQELGEVSRVRNMSPDCSYCPFKNVCQADLRGQDSKFIRKNEFTVKEKLGELE